MNYHCLLVNFSSQVKTEELKEKFEGQELPLGVLVADNELGAKEFFSSNSIAGLVIFTDDYKAEIKELLNVFNHSVGCLPEFQIIICDDPSPTLMANVFEHGIEFFMGMKEWYESTLNLIEKINVAILDDESTEGKCLRLNSAIKTSDHEVVSTLEQRLGDESSHNYVAAYSYARALESAGKYQDALDVFTNAEKLNDYFMPAKMGTGENLLLTGKVDDAIAKLEDLEKRNPSNHDRKLVLANAYCEKGDVEKAEQLIAQAEELAPNNKKVTESKVHFLIASKKIGDALKLCDDLEEIGPHLASKLNDIGVSLSKSGKAKTALSLYKKAHKIVRKELKYKVSMNAALACHRAQSFDLAIKYLDRCKKEYGSSFEKLDKIYRAVEAARDKKNAVSS